MDVVEYPDHPELGGYKFTPDEAKKVEEWLEKKKEAEAENDEAHEKIIAAYAAPATEKDVEWINSVERDGRVLLIEDWLVRAADVFGVKAGHASHSKEEPTVPFIEIKLKHKNEPWRDHFRKGGNYNLLEARLRRCGGHNGEPHIVLDTKLGKKIFCFETNKGAEMARDKIAKLAIKEKS